MCRFVLYSGPSVTLSSLLVEPANSLIHQSFHGDESEDPLNGDGFGIAWYVPKHSLQPALFRSMSPAWSNRNLVSLSRVTESECILAHIRAATLGLAVSESNCHPFASGRFAFMHNGDIGAFRRIRRKLIESLSDRAFNTVQGAMDSEYVFAVLLDEIGFGDLPRTVAALADGVRRTIAQLEAPVRKSGEAVPSYLNLAVTDGRNAAVSRFVSGGRSDAASLHNSAGGRYECYEGACRMRSVKPSEYAMIVSSEPLSGDKSWQEIPAGDLVTIDEHRNVQMLSI
ncbi:MAG: class II glutamine amidotransferase [Phycisphaerae bacterium]|nr:class II glutamine amidotransferase [Phycisphaerae bacterium]